MIAAAVLVALLAVLLGIVLGVAFLDVVVGLVAVTAAVIVCEPILGVLRASETFGQRIMLAIRSWLSEARGVRGGACEGMVWEAIRYSLGRLGFVGYVSFSGFFVHTFISKSCKNHGEMT